MKLLHFAKGFATCALIVIACGFNYQVVHELIAGYQIILFNLGFMACAAGLARQE